jgi:RNA polymerase sigma factor (sigma-70 family)
MGLSEPDAQDVAQEALIRGWRHREQLREGSPRAWFATIARNEARRLLARRGDAAAGVELDLLAAADGWEDSLLRVEVWRAKQELTDEDRTLLDMHYRLDLSYSAIAIHFGIPLGTVKVRLHRARTRLRPHLAEGRI